MDEDDIFPEEDELSPYQIDDLFDDDDSLEDEDDDNEISDFGQGGIPA